MKMLVLFGCVLLAGCGGTITITRTVTAPATQTTGHPPSGPKTATSGGITLRVLTVRTASGVSYLGKAKPGQHFVYVATRVTNNTRVGLDLSCGVPVRTVLVDSTNRTFEPIKSLSKLRGNPKCNAMLARGSSGRMTWVFLTSRSTKVNALAFTDFTDTSKPGPFQQIQL